MGLGRVGSGRRGVLEGSGLIRSGHEVVKQQLVRVADPHRRVAMVSQRISRVGMEENVQRAVVKRQPFDDIGELCALESKLVRPFGMRADRLLVETAEL